MSTAEMNYSETPNVDQRIAASVRALAAGRGMRNVELSDVLGVGANAVFMKLRGDSPWKATEVAALAEHFDVSVGDLFDGLGLFGDTTKPHRRTGGASSVGAPSGIRTPDPLIKSLPERQLGSVIEVDFGETRGRRSMVG